MVSKVFQSASGSRWRGLLLHGRGDAAGTFLVLLSISPVFLPPRTPFARFGRWTDPPDPVGPRKLRAQQLTPRNTGACVACSLPLTFVLPLQRYMRTTPP